MIRLSAFADEISQDPQEQIDVLAQNGIRHIEFRAIHGTNVLDLGDAQHDEFRSRLRAAGFGLSAIGSPIGKIRVTEPLGAHLARFEKALELAEFYETPRIRVFSFYIPAGDAPSKHREEVIARMKELADRAASRKVTLLLENEKGIYGDTAHRVADLLDAVDSPALAHAFDPANYVEVGENTSEAWHLVERWIRHFHVKDYDNQSRRNVPAGEGDGQIPSLVQRAVQAGYDGYAVLEPHLIVAEASFGFTGPERFGEAATALKNILGAHQIAYA
jgi:sugar phosphate isomerase/epimerase